MNPVAQNDEFAAMGERIIEQDVTVAEHKIIDGSIGVVGLVVLGKGNEWLFVGSGEDGFLGRVVTGVG